VGSVKNYAQISGSGSVKNGSVKNYAQISGRVVSRIMRKLVCRLWVNQVNRQKRRPQR